MKNIQLLALTVLLLVVFSASNNRPVHIFMAGDSTMALKPLSKTVWDSIAGDSVTDKFPERGWGQLLPEFFNENVVVQDYAQNGRSSRTFIEQGWWQKIINEMQAGDYVVVQFGHNDEAQTKPDRYTTPEQYVENLTRFVKEVRAKGGKPIICTSVVRRRFDKAGNFLDSHGVYVDLARQVAKDNNVLMIDMYEKSKRHLVDLGVENSTALFLHVKPGVTKVFPEGRIDNTHFVEGGARKMASFFVEGLVENKESGLAKDLKQ